MCYDVHKILDERRRIEPIGRITNASNKFNAMLEERKRCSLFEDGKLIEVIPRITMDNASEIIINKLHEKGAFRFFAEMINERIYISVKIQNEIQYKNLLVYDSFWSFEKDFIIIK